jgi:hypothetical protein
LRLSRRSYPAAPNKEEIATRAGYETNGGGFNDALGRTNLAFSEWV